MTNPARDPLALGAPPEAYLLRWLAVISLMCWLFLVVDPFALNTGLGALSTSVMGFCGVMALWCLLPEGAHMTRWQLILLRVLLLVLPFGAPGYCSVVWQICGRKPVELDFDWLLRQDFEYMSLDQRRNFAAQFLKITSQYLDMQALFFTAFVVGGVLLALTMFLLPALEARRNRRRALASAQALR